MYPLRHSDLLFRKKVTQTPFEVILWHFWKSSYYLLLICLFLKPLPQLPCKRNAHVFFVLSFVTVCGKFDTFSRNNLSDTQWPWHVAIYIRSPPDHTVSTYGSPGRIIMDQQGAAEEFTFWSLACSGALVAQHRVLVSAQCVVDKNKQPEHVKVVLGKQYHTARDALKSQHHLRVKLHMHNKFILFKCT